MDLSSIIASTSGVVALLGCAASLYYRATSAEMDKRLAVAEARIVDLRESVSANYRYCHDEVHATNKVLMQHFSRLRVLETSLEIPVGPDEA